MRGQVAESFANIPYNEWPDKEILQSYVPRNYKTEEDFAWSSLFKSALNWLNDREARNKRKAREEMPKGNSSRGR